MYHADDVEYSLSPSPIVVVVVVEYPYRLGGVLNYCNFEVYLLITLMFLWGESFVFYCTPMFLLG